MYFLVTASIGWYTVRSWVFVCVCCAAPDKLTSPPPFTGLGALQSEYVFGSLVRSRLLSLCNGSIVITIEVHWVHCARDNSKFGNELFDPNGLLRRIGCSNILSLCRRIGNCVLL